MELAWDLDLVIVPEVLGLVDTVMLQLQLSVCVNVGAQVWDGVAVALRLPLQLQLPLQVGVQLPLTLPLNDPLPLPLGLSNHEPLRDPLPLLLIDPLLLKLPVLVTVHDRLPLGEADVLRVLVGTAVLLPVTVVEGEKEGLILPPGVGDGLLVPLQLTLLKEALTVRVGGIRHIQQQAARM